MSGIIIPKKHEGDIPDFVEINVETEVISFSVKKGYQCLRFSMDDVKDENTGERISLIWWEFYIDKVPAQKISKGIRVIKREEIKIADFLKIYARGGNYFSNGNFSFGFAFVKK